MSCPFAAGMNTLSCRATLSSYAPSRSEISEYCSDGKYEQYRLCGYYRRAVWGGLTDFLTREQRQSCGE